MRRQTKPTITALMTLMALVLVACGNGAAPGTTTAETAAPATTQADTPDTTQAPGTTAATEDVTITIWHGYNPVETEVFENQVIPDFVEATGISVDALAVPFDEFRRKLLTAIAGGTAPDLIRADLAWVPEFAAMGALVPLSQEMPDFDDYAAAVFEGPLSTNLHQGEYYGLPLDTNTRVAVYNPDTLAAAGLDGIGSTFEELTASCEALAANGTYCFADGGTYGWAVGPWIWSHGGAMISEDATTASGAYDSPATVAAYQFMADAVANDWWHPGILGGGVDTMGGLASGEIAMVLEGPWFPPLFEGQFADVPYEFALMPAGDGGSVSVVGGEDIVMFQQSQNKEAAAEFIRHMLSPEVQLQLAEVGQMPVLTALSDDPAISGHPFFGIFFDQIATARARPVHPAWPEMEQIVTNTGNAILSGDADAASALADAVAQIDPLLGE